MINPTINLQNVETYVALLMTTLCSACLLGCATGSTSTPNIGRQAFGRTKEGISVDLFTLRNSHGAEVKISNYGGLVISLKVPDRNGKLGDVVLGYDNLDG